MCLIQLLLEDDNMPLTIIHHCILVFYLVLSFKMESIVNPTVWNKQCYYWTQSIKCWAREPLCPCVQCPNTPDVTKYHVRHHIKLYVSATECNIYDLTPPTSSYMPKTELVLYIRLTKVLATERRLTSNPFFNWLGPSSDFDWKRTHMKMGSFCYYNTKLCWVV